MTGPEESDPDLENKTRIESFLQQLERDDFLPPASDVVSSPVWNHGHSAEERGEEYQRFVARYWSLEPAERRRQWQRLMARNPHGRIATQIRRLECGLDLADATPLEDEIQRRFAALLMELFLLPTRSRLMGRHWALDVEGDLKAYRPHFRELERLRPNLLQLDPPTVERIEGDPRLKAEWNFQTAGEVRAKALQARYRKFAIGVAVLFIPLMFGLIAYFQTVRPESRTDPLPLNAHGEPANPDDALLFSSHYTERELIAYFDFVPQSGKKPPPGWSRFITEGGEELLAAMRRRPWVVAHFRSQIDKEDRRKLTELLMTRKTIPAGTRSTRGTGP